MQDERIDGRGTGGGKPSESQRMRNREPTYTQISTVAAQPLADSGASKKANEPGKTTVLVLRAGGFQGDSDIVRMPGRDFMLSRVASGLDIFRTSVGYGMLYGQRDIQVRDRRVRTAEEFFSFLEEGEDNVSKVIFIGHGSSKGELGLSGSVILTYAIITDLVDVDAVRAMGGNEERVEAIRHRLTPNATCDICACGVGQGREFLVALANLLNRPVRAYTGYVVWRYEMRDSRYIPTGRIGYRRLDTADRPESYDWGANKKGMTVKELFERINPNTIRPQQSQRKR